MRPIALTLLLVLHGRPGAPPDTHPTRVRDVRVVAHSHNDYEQRAPLAQALAAGFPSVEADVWLREGEIVVSHTAWYDRGRLVDLYLDPLQARVARLGSVHGDDRIFYLWIDLKQSSRELTEALHALLSRYPMFTAFRDDGWKPGPVVAILTGDEEAKRRYTEEHAVRFACRDANRMAPDDGPSDGRFTWYALPWGDVVDGPGFAAHGTSALERKLRAVVERIHALGRRLRLYEVPEQSEAWDAAIAAGVDLIGTDHIEAFRSHVGLGEIAALHGAP